MKRTILAFTLFAALAGLAGAQPAAKLASNEAFAIMNNLPLYLESKGSLAFKDSLVIGDRVTVTSRATKFTIEGKEREYLRVKMPSGTEGWVRAAYLAQKCSLAVVKADKATVYTEPRDVKMTSKSISGMTIVALFDEGSNATFAKVVAYDPVQDAYYTDPPVYLETGDLSNSDVDINSVILYMTAMGTKNKDLRANFFKKIEKLYSSSVFFDRIRAALFPGAAPGKPSAPASGSYLLNDDNVNVRAQPDELNGQVVARLNTGTQVEVLEATTQEYPLGGQSARWYRIKDPAGWVFGSFLTPVQ